jgi:diacylglycerol kinase family enzyme
VSREVDTRLDARVVTLDRMGRWREAVDAALLSGVRSFVAAGGDGTVHALVERLVEGRGPLPLDALTLFAVGLGSSNDFHKPFRSVHSGIPLRVDRERAAPRDVGLVRFTDGAGRARRSVLVVSASAGVVAEGNALFERGRPGRRLTGLLIAGSALRAVARSRSFRARLRHDDVDEEIALSSLSVLKTAWLSGSLRYDLPVAADDGAFTVGLCEGMGRARLLTTLAGLACGRFRGKGTRAFRTTSLGLSSEEPFLLEIDGEVTTARDVRFEILPERIRACA